MNQEQTIHYLKEQYDEDENIYEQCLKNNYIIFYASLLQRDNFLMFCAKEKIFFPQVALYVHLASNNIYMCDICVFAGCKIDEVCMKIACSLFEENLIKYCMKFNIMPTQNNIKLLLTKSNDNVYYSGGLKPLTDESNLNSENFLKSLMYYISFSTISANNIWFGHANLCGILNWWRDKHNPNKNLYDSNGKRKKVLENMRKKKESCINFIKKSGFEFDEKILDLCQESNIKFYNFEFYEFSDMLIDQLIKHEYIKEWDSDDNKKEFCEKYMFEVFGSEEEYDCVFFDALDIQILFNFNKNKKYFKEKFINKEEKEELKLNLIYSKTTNPSGVSNMGYFEVFAIYEYGDYIIKYCHDEELEPLSTVHIETICDYYDSIFEYLNKTITLIPKNSFFGPNNTNLLQNATIVNTMSLEGVIRLFKCLFDNENKFLEYCISKYHSCI
jgi:hypothetical protein